MFILQCRPCSGTPIRWQLSDLNYDCTLVQQNITKCGDKIIPDHNNDTFKDINQLQLCIEITQTSFPVMKQLAFKAIAQLRTTNFTEEVVKHHSCRPHDWNPDRSPQHFNQVDHTTSSNKNHPTIAK
ncbi:hypothetical protein SNE40_020668 [Patella caerulea]|uniref:Uncharacterized protein n=1 Tax=Patella caerulea TaxID=87958 RepID=A0AAN8J4U0_PATCE